MATRKPKPKPTPKPTTEDTREAAIARCLEKGIGDPTEDDIKAELK